MTAIKLSLKPLAAIGIASALAFTSCETVDNMTDDWNELDNKQKGTILGGVGGAVAGAAVSGKKVTGAIIGGAAGAFGGRKIGENKDEKEAEEGAFLVE